MIRPRWVVSFALALAVLSCAALKEAAGQDAPGWVEQGIQRFEQGDYEGAKKAFAEADVAKPDDAAIAFDQACALAAAADADKARDLFQRAALSRDTDLSARARYNLGVLASEKARALFGEHPGEATPEQRSEGLDLLHGAVGHFREVLDLKPDHEDARHNIELIRLWIKHMEALWKERDRDKQREELNLLQFLEMLDQRQSALRSATRAIVREADSPKRRQALKDTELEQRSLVEEIEPLKKKIEEAVRGPAGGAAQGPGAPAGQPGPPPGMDPAQADKAIETLNGFAEEAGAHMTKAAEWLAETPDESPGSQTSALESLDKIYQAAAPFQTLLQKALGVQQGLVDTTSPLAETPEEADKAGGDVCFEDLSWSQNRVGTLSNAMTYKAQQELKKLKESEGSDAAGAPKPPTPPPPAGGDPNQAAAQQQEAIKRAMEKAVELQPEILHSTAQAADSLKKEDSKTALPDEEEALKKLKEIADELPKQDQQKQDQQQNQDQNQQQKQDQQQKQEQQEKQQKQEQKQVSREEAERLLQKAKEQEKEYRDKAAQPAGASDRVDKDW